MTDSKRGMVAFSQRLEQAACLARDDGEKVEVSECELEILHIFARIGLGHFLASRRPGGGSGPERAEQCRRRVEEAMDATVAAFGSSAMAALGGVSVIIEGRIGQMFKKQENA